MPVNIYGIHLNAYEYLSSDENIDIYCDTKEYHENDHIKIFHQLEPDEYSHMYEYLKCSLKKYDYIFVYEPLRIGNEKHIYRITYGNSWIKENDVKSINTTNKEFKISFLAGWKLNTHAHFHRRNLFINQKQFSNFPIIFYRSSQHIIIDDVCNNPILPEHPYNKIELFRNYQFSIVIENTREENCFSEKLIDCLITKTIPIYYGCANISSYFDTTGWIIISSVDYYSFLEELYSKLLSLSPDYYEKHITRIEKNYELAEKYSNLSLTRCQYFSIIPALKIEFAKIKKIEYI